MISMVLHFQNADLLFDAFFLSILRYWRRARVIFQASTCKKCGGVWWCMCMHNSTCTTPNIHQPGLYCTNEVLSNMSYFAVWVVATTQTP